MGLEPTTLGITIRCSNQLSYIHRKTGIGAPDRNRTCNRRLRRPMLYPVELQAQSLSAERVAGRGRGIRTPDFCVPNATLYQTELYPAFESPVIYHRSLEMLRVTPRSVNPCRSTPLFLNHRFRGRNSRPFRENKTGCKHPASPYKNGAPGEIRTPDHLVRSQVLYPTELRAH